MPIDPCHRVEPTGLYELVRDVLQRTHGLEVGVVIKLPIICPIGANPADPIKMQSVEILVGEYSRNLTPQGKHDLIMCRIAAGILDVQDYQIAQTHKVTEDIEQVDIP